MGKSPELLGTPRMTTLSALILYKCGAVDGMGIWRGNLNTLIKPAPVPLCSQIPRNWPEIEPGLPLWEPRD
jgi:hypothetical protein